jgi:hypothetical protein
VAVAEAVTFESGGILNGETVDTRNTAVAYIYVPAAMDTNNQSHLSFQERYQHLDMFGRGYFLRLV